MKGILLISLLASIVPVIGNKGDYDLQNEKFLNFLSAIQNTSTFSYFTVIAAKNLNTGETREICTKGNFISGALHVEMKLGYSPLEEKKVFEFARKHKDRYFEFKDQKALENISFYDYNPKLILKIEKKYDIAKIVQIIKETKTFSCGLPDNEMKLLAHSLYERGFMTGENNCFGGTLQYVERNQINY
jgi:hypothetical protein